MRVALTVIVLGTACALAIFGFANAVVHRATQKSQDAMLHWFELTTPTPRGLDPSYRDEDHDLTADPPKDPAGRRSPDVLLFAFVAGPTAEDELRDWKDFVDHLSRITGKPVETRIYDTTADQQAAIKDGELHVAAFNTGAVPAAVASAGFVPFCTFGQDDGSFGIKMQFIVPAKSSIQKLEDIKGHSVAFTTRDSNSGCKAALALLQDNDLLPQRDYSWQFSGSHEESIARIAAGEFKVAPVASDLLQRALGAGTVKAEQIRTIYESERFPPVTLGYAYDLADDLAAKIRQAFFEFDRHGTSLQRRFDDSQTTKFVPLSYKQDYALIRRIDSAFRKPTRPVGE